MKSVLLFFLVIAHAGSVAEAGVGAAETGAVTDAGGVQTAAVEKPGTPSSQPHGDHGGDAGRKGPHDATSRHPFDDVAKWSAVFDDPARDAWQKPAALVNALGLKRGNRVADLGAGTGYFLKYLSEAVAEEGIVWALDTEPKMVEHMTERAQKAGLKNVRPRTCPADSPGLPDDSVDLVLVVDTWHHLDDRLEYLKKLAGVLASGGRVAIVDFKKDAPPPPGPPKEHRLDRTFVVAEFQTAGWTLLEEPRLLEHQYVLIFKIP